MKIGVLAVQGAFVEHIEILRQLKVDTLPIRLPRELAGLDGLIIPGGESTSISKLMLTYNLMTEVKNLAQSGLPIFGTCAGMIILASNISDSDVTPLGVMEITVGRNSFGRQRESFEAELSMPVLGEKPFPAVFIRAPVIKKVNGKAEILARLDDGTAVAARQGKLLVSAFHPELTSDLRFHQYFLDIVSGSRESGG
jgi:5'-phosphate synthase pdxT subunit